MAVERIKTKTKLLTFRASEDFANILKNLAKKKSMSQSNLIEYLVRREAEREAKESK